MAFRITITADAEAQLRALPVRDQRVLEAAILARLQHQPATPTRAIKRLRPNLLAGFELRVGALRVLYNCASCIMWKRPKLSFSSSVAKWATN